LWFQQIVPSPSMSPRQKLRGSHAEREQARDNLGAVDRPAHEVLARAAGRVAARVARDGDRGVAASDASSGFDSVTVGDRESQHDSPSTVGCSVGEKKPEQPELFFRQRVGEQVRPVRVPAAMVRVVPGPSSLDRAAGLLDEPVDRGRRASDQLGDLRYPERVISIEVQDASHRFRRQRRPPGT
jgi:hypothetical protein